MAILEILKKSMESIEKSLNLIEEREVLFRIAESRGEDRTVERQKLEDQKQKLVKEGAQTMTEIERIIKKEEAQDNEPNE